MSETGINNLCLPGRFDYSYHRQLSELYNPLIEGTLCKEIALDFSQVKYLYSSALGMMVSLQKKSSEYNINVKIKETHGAADEISKMADMQKIFEFI